ncbi:hypothetical protein HY605_02315, partial [Candidatus Peregrinibacteria bacterium]|nr:hypothetical protein [Candidatus Peregrinibacteria bacterium]
MKKTLLLILCLCSPSFIWGQDKESIDKQKRLAEETQKLENMMDKLIYELAEKHPAYAERLRAGLAKLKSDLVEEKIKFAIEELEKNNPGNALAHGKSVEESLEVILAILEDRSDAKETQKKMEQVKEALSKLKELAEKEREIKKAVNELNKERNKDINELTKKLEDIIDKEQSLNDQTNSGPPEDLMEELKNAASKLGVLMKKQDDLNKELDNSQNPELKNISELSKK